MSFNYQFLSGADIKVNAAQRTTSSGINIDWPAVCLVFGPDGGPFNLVGSSQPLPVDTELPAASALADTMANPTTALVGACLMGWDNGSSKWNRVRYTTSAGLDVNVVGGGPVAIKPQTPVTLLNLASATYTSTQDPLSGTFDTTAVSTLVFMANITAASGNLVIAIKCLGADGIYYPVYTSGTISSTGTQVVSVGPGTGNTHVLTGTTKVVITLSSTPSFTMSVSVIGR